MKKFKLYKKVFVSPWPLASPIGVMLLTIGFASYSYKSFKSFKSDVILESKVSLLNNRFVGQKKFYTINCNNDFCLTISDKLFDDGLVIKGKVIYLNGKSEYFFNDDKRFRFFMQFKYFYVIRIGSGVYIFYDSDQLKYLQNFFFKCSNNRFKQLHKFLFSKKFKKIKKDIIEDFDKMKKLNISNRNAGFYKSSYFIDFVEVNDQVIVNYDINIENFKGIVYIYKKILLFKSNTNQIFLYENNINEVYYFDFEKIIIELNKIAEILKIW